MCSLKFFLSDIIICIVAFGCIFYLCSNINKYINDKATLEELEKESKKKKKIELRKKEVIFVICVLYLISIFIPSVINILYKIGDSGKVFFYTKLEIGYVFNYYGDFLAFIGTISLGTLALWQNNKLDERNREYEEQIILSQKKEKNFEREKEISVVKPNFRLVSKSQSGRIYEIELENLTDHNAKDIKLLYDENQEIVFEDNVNSLIGLKKEIIVKTKKFPNDITGKKYNILIKCKDKYNNEYQYKCEITGTSKVFFKFENLKID